MRLFGKSGGVGPLSDPVVRDAAASAIGADLPFNPNADVQDITREGDTVVVRFTEDGVVREERFDWLLAATGRAPALAGLDLAASGLKLDERGVPEIDPLTMQAQGGQGRAAGRASGAHLLAWAVQAGMDVETALEMPFYHPVLEEGLRTALRDLSVNLGRRIDNPPHCIDCGPGA